MQFTVNMDAVEAVRETVSTAAGVTLSTDFSISPQGFTFHINTNNKVVGAALAIYELV